MSAASGGSLTTIFTRLIAATGPISVAHFMAESNARYYASRDPLGIAGDFVTAPEISQMFGELIGLWLADMWIRAGRDEPVHYVELGPGRGTLARDALMAAKRYGLTPRVHFVETSTALKARQLALHPTAQWHHDLSTLPTLGPLLIVANEFLDALPVRQLVRAGAGWRERMVGHDGERFVFVAGSQPMDAALPAEFRDAPEGAIFETCPAAAATIGEVAGRLATQGGAALLIDYGADQAQLGSTLQAVRAHHKLDPFAAPGEADLTAHVDFSVLARIAQARGVRWLGTVSQSHFLRTLGIEARAENLAAFAPQDAPAIFAARDRLTGDDQMGALFKVMGLAAERWPEAGGFQAKDGPAQTPARDANRRGRTARTLCPKMLLASAPAMSIRPAKRGIRARWAPVLLQGGEGAILARLDRSDEGAGCRPAVERSDSEVSDVLRQV